jgi:hypothetical protein
MKQNKTKVVFLIEKPEGNLQCDVFAFFPNSTFSNSPVHEGKMFDSYAHIGQHSACHIDYANECKEATKEQYLPLLNELLSIGYDNLEILNKN